jgi:hypothetical protein
MNLIAQPKRDPPFKAFRLVLAIGFALLGVVSLVYGFTSGHTFLQFLGILFLATAPVHFMRWRRDVALPNGESTDGSTSH